MAAIESVTLIENDPDSPIEIAMPVMSPVEALSDNPDGSVPGATTNVVDPVSPVSVGDSLTVSVVVNDQSEE